MSKQLLVCDFVLNLWFTNVFVGKYIYPQLQWPKCDSSNVTALWKWASKLLRCLNLMVTNIRGKKTDCTTRHQPRHWFWALRQTQPMETPRNIWASYLNQKSYPTNWWNNSLPWSDVQNHSIQPKFQAPAFGSWVTPAQLRGWIAIMRTQLRPDPEALKVQPSLHQVSQTFCH